MSPRATGAPGAESPPPAAEVHTRGRFEKITLALMALGVVFGDIGTSPLYAIRAAFSASTGLTPTPPNVLGVISLIFWSLILVISVKYLGVVMRADNRGEGGMLALAALVTSDFPQRSRVRTALLAAGVTGAALLYADGVITPSISVISAVEGIGIATPALEPVVVPVTVVILIGLFAIQHRGTSVVGALFAPITVAWFVTISVLGVTAMIREPSILAAVNPVHGAAFLMENGKVGFATLGAVFLVVTGGEALYADMGHFGRGPIRVGWFTLVLPALLLNYFGQGASILADPAAASHPFFALAPAWGLWPLVILATLAAIVASQAVISGAFSLTRQAIQLGYLPRLHIEHTSSKHIGQVYVGAINRLLLIVCLGLVLGFRTSEDLAAAYGVAVSTTMVLTGVLVTILARRRWHWSWPLVLALPGVLTLIDASFLAANVAKIPHGGWFPIVLATTLVIIMEVWQAGARRANKLLDDRKLSDQDFLAMIEYSPPARVSGTAVFMHRQTSGIPPSLLHNLKHNQVLHERVWLVSVVTREVPRVPDEDRVEYKPLGQGVARITLYYGFMEEPDVPAALASCRMCGKFELNRTTFFFGRETLIPGRGGMLKLAKHLYIMLARNSQPARAFFRIPPNRVVELGAQIDF